MLKIILLLFPLLLLLLVSPLGLFNRIFLLPQTTLERFPFKETEAQCWLQQHIYKETEAQQSEITCPSSQGLEMADLGMFPRTILCCVALVSLPVLRRGTALSLPRTTYSERKANRVLCRCHF